MDAITAGLEKLVLRGLEKSLQRIARVSAGTWRVAGVRTYVGSAAEALSAYAARPAAAVYMVMEAMPLCSVMAAEPADIPCISEGFTGVSFSSGPRISAAEEVMLSELGNILMNALVNEIINALKTSLLPALPVFASGNAAELTGRLGPCAARPGRVIAARLALECSGKAAEWDLFALLPEELAAQLT